MNNTNKKQRYLLFIITIAYFLLPMINIYFAFTAVGCMIIPFILLAHTKRKTWCSGYCPRADFLSKSKFLNIGLKTPNWLKRRAIRRNMLIYFGINLFFVTMSTIMVSLGRVDPIEKIRLLIVFQLPFGIPELFGAAGLSPVLMHLAHRFYSLMLTSSLLGLILGILFRPRTWCTICPINTISTKFLKTSTEVVNE